MILLILIFCLLAIIYITGIIKLKQALNELEDLRNGYMARRIDMIYEECKRKEIDDGK